MKKIDSGHAKRKQRAEKLRKEEELKVKIPRLTTYFGRKQGQGPGAEAIGAATEPATAQDQEAEAASDSHHHDQVPRPPTPCK